VAREPFQEHSGPHGQAVAPGGRDDRHDEDDAGILPA
jgi:hypothetical protein